MTYRAPVGANNNDKGVFLHVLADALGSVVVLVSASIIWLSDWQYRSTLLLLLLLLPSVGSTGNQAIVVNHVSLPMHNVYVGP